MTKLLVIVNASLVALTVWLAVQTKSNQRQLEALITLDEDTAEYLAEMGWHCHAAGDTREECRAQARVLIYRAEHLSD